MQYLPSLLFGISVSLDALLAGAVCSIRRGSIPLWQNLVISSISLAGTCLSVGLGLRLTELLPAAFWNLTGSILLILLGFYYLVKYGLSILKRRSSKGQTGAAQHKNTASPNPLSPDPLSAALRSSCTLGFALSGNNIGVGLSASIAGLPLFSAAWATFLFSFIFLLLGNRLGQCRFLRLTEHTADLTAGLLLILLGTLELYP